MNRRRATRGERRALLVFVGLCVALSYRPGHVWSGLAGGVVALVLIALFAMIGRTLAHAAETKLRRRR
jgi:hypothetical protein